MKLAWVAWARPGEWFGLGQLEPLARYMANDMQFFLTSPFIIFALWKNRNIGLGLLAGLLVIFTAIPTALGFIEEWGFSPALLAGADQARQGDYMMEFYIVPWCRLVSPGVL